MRGSLEGYIFEFDGRLYFIPEQTFGAGSCVGVRTPEGFYFGGMWSKDTGEFLPLGFFWFQGNDLASPEFIVVPATYLLTADSA